MDPRNSSREYPPLLEPGLHQQTLPELWKICVEDFTDPSRRFRIMQALQSLVQELEDAGVGSEIWVDGSFLTEKPEPNDVDAVVFFEAGILSSGPQIQREALNSLRAGLPRSSLCDLYLVGLYPSPGPFASENERSIQYWEDQFGKDRQGKAKGIAAIRTGSGPWNR